MNKMKQLGWLDTFRDWFGVHAAALDRHGITVELPTETHGSGIYADLKSGHYEATVQLWENGLSDFHVLDWRVADDDPDYQVEVTHHEFQSEGELFMALDSLVQRMSLSTEGEITDRVSAVAGRA